MTRRPLLLLTGLLSGFVALHAPAQKAQLLVTHAHIFTMAPGQQAPFDGYLAVAADGTILSAAAGSPPPSMHAAHITDAHGDWIIPGFISAHSHLWQAAYRGLAASSTLHGWIDDLYGQRAKKASADDLYWFCLYGGLDHLQHGVTAAYNFNYSGSSPEANRDNAFDKSEFRAEQNSGIRFVHGFGPDRVLTTAPQTLPNARARLKSFLDWSAEQPHTTRFLSVMINGETAFNDTPDQAVLEAALMREFHLRNQSHYLEAPDDIAAERAKFPWFVNGGLVTSETFYGHFIHTDDAILTAVAKAYGGMSWNPLSNGRLASGIADIPKYRKAGLRIGMGVDGEASADLADPFENMRTGLYAIRDLYMSAASMSPYDVLYLQTMGSADVLGVKDKLGSLEPKKFADFLLISPNRLGAVLEDPYANLILVAAERDIDAVYVGGRLAVDHGRVLTSDLHRAEQESAKRVLREK
jgi:5-methylthioadenosine/S-adenosylhomocysteine deaminase